MKMALTPEVEQRLERRLREGRWHSPSDFLTTALDIIDDLDEVIVLDKAELNAKLDESSAAIDRGDVIDSEEFEAFLNDWRAKA